MSKYKSPLHSILSFIAKGKISSPVVTLSEQVLCRGDSLLVRLEFSAKTHITLGETFAELCCQEVSGVLSKIIYQSRVTFALEQKATTADAYRDNPEQHLPLPEDIESGETIMLVATLLIPTDAPITFSALPGGVESMVNIHLGIQGWPDWRDSFPITIHPGRYAKTSQGLSDIETSKKALPFARRESWKTQPMPIWEAHPSSGLTKKYSLAEFEEIKRGLVPEEMEDKWFIFYEEPWLYLHRSWTGFCIFQVRFERADSQVRIAQVLANRHPDQRTSMREEEELATLLQLLGFLAARGLASKERG
jgi:hypothetical protein